MLCKKVSVLLHCMWSHSVCRLADKYQYCKWTSCLLEPRRRM